jgi:hypothetical protein
LRFSEEDLRRTKFRLHELENESEDLLEKYSKLCCEISTNHQQGMTQSLIVSSPYAEEDKWRVPQIARRVSDGEQPNEKLQQPKLELEQLEQQNTSSSRDQQKSEKQASKNGEEATTNMKFLEVELRKEKQEREELGKTVAYYKQFIASTGEHKMKILNTEMEMLKNQSTMLKERIDFLHSQEKLPSNASSEYVDRLKARCDSLEEELAQMKAEQDFRLMETAESTDKNANEIDNGKALATSDDIEQACIMLASVDAQANRIFKQLEKLDGGNISKAERRRSLNKEGLHYANLVVDLANVLTELRILHQLLHYKRLLPQDSTSESSMVTIVATASNNKDDNTNLLLTPPNSAHCKECSKSESNISDLREEVIFYKKKNKELTNQILRTDQWHAEMERQEKTHAASVFQISRFFSSKRSF